MLTAPTSNRLRARPPDLGKPLSLNLLNPMEGNVAHCTNIRVEVLNGQQDLSGVSVAEKMSWLADRTSTREEDMSYCLLGILGVQLLLW